MKLKKQGEIIVLYKDIRKDGRAVECVGLENRITRKGNWGSNPYLSAKKIEMVAPVAGNIK